MAKTAVEDPSLEDLDALNSMDVAEYAAKINSIPLSLFFSRDTLLFKYLQKLS